MAKRRDLPLVLPRPLLGLWGPFPDGAVGPFSVHQVTTPSGEKGDVLTVEFEVAQRLLLSATSTAVRCFKRGESLLVPDRH